MDDLEHGRKCYDRRAWADAYHALRVPIERVRSMARISTD
jgi:hypothetical protein